MSFPTLENNHPRMELNIVLKIYVCNNFSISGNHHIFYVHRIHSVKAIDLIDDDFFST